MPEYYGSTLGMSMKTNKRKIITVYDNVLYTKNLLIHINEANEHYKNNLKKIYLYERKKLFTIESEWEVMNQDYANDENNEIHSYYNFYKNYNISIMKIPTKNIPRIEYMILFKYDDEKILMTEYTSKTMFIYLDNIKNPGEKEEIADVSLQIPYEIRNDNVFDKPTRVYCKLILKIYNPHYYE